MKKLIVLSELNQPHNTHPAPFCSDEALESSEPQRQKVDGGARDWDAGESVFSGDQASV